MDVSLCYWFSNVPYTSLEFHSLFVLSHLKRPEGRGHEEGAATSLAQLRGSASIAQLSDIVLGAERNGQADDLIERNTTHVRVLKNRFSGITGPACSLLYSKETGRMIEQAEVVDSEVL
jgi:twinkle protein